MSVLLEFALFPVGKGESVSKYVARSLKIIDNSGIEYKIGPMGTVLEGEFDELMGIVKQCYEKMKEDCPRIYGWMTIDYRKGREKGLAGKVRSVEEKLRKRLKKS